MIILYHLHFMSTHTRIDDRDRRGRFRRARLCKGVHGDVAVTDRLVREPRKTAARISRSPSLAETARGGRLEIQWLIAQSNGRNASDGQFGAFGFVRALVIQVSFGVDSELNNPIRNHRATFDGEGSRCRCRIDIFGKVHRPHPESVGSVRKEGREKWRTAEAEPFTVKLAFEFAFLTRFEFEGGRRKYRGALRGAGGDRRLRWFQVSDDREGALCGSGVYVFEFVYGAHFICMFAGSEVLGYVGRRAWGKCF